jgi:bifunctional DNase/RNase
MDSPDLVPVRIKKLAASPNGFALFLGPESKTFVIYLGPDVGAAILMFQQGVKKPRPLTHDLIVRIFAALEVSLERVVINDLKDNTYFAQLHLRQENELGTKLAVIDARPSDCIALAVEKNAPIFVKRRVLELAENAEPL